MSNNIILLADSYKYTHHEQYPFDENGGYVTSYIEPRGPKGEEVMFFGLQAFIKEYLTARVTKQDVDEAEAIIAAHIGPDTFNRAGWDYIVDELEGRLPLYIEAVDEGSVLPASNMQVKVKNTDPKCFWLTSFMETALLRAVWYPSTVATKSFKLKKVWTHYMEKTSDNLESLPFKLHDFGARGVSSAESAGLGGAAHLVNFMGTDTVSGLIAARKYYDADMAGFSVAASEHSTMTSWGRDGEHDAFDNMLNKFGKEGAIVSIVIDSYNQYDASLWLFSQYERAKKGGFKIVLRPDSGTPEVVVKELLKNAESVLGDAITINSKGYKVLPAEFGLLWGDGINVQSSQTILSTMAQLGWSADNILFGMGGELLQTVNRDTYSYAMKTCFIEFADNEGRVTQTRDVFKDPIDDKGKMSKRGDLYTVMAPLAPGEVKTFPYELLRGSEVHLLNPVYFNGGEIKPKTFEQVREKAASYL